MADLNGSPCRRCGATIPFAPKKNWSRPWYCVDCRGIVAAERRDRERNRQRRQRRYAKTCASCGVDFVAIHRDRRFCDGCYRPTLQCIDCGGIFRLGRSHGCVDLTKPRRCKPCAARYSEQCERIRLMRKLTALLKARAASDAKRPRPCLNCGAIISRPRAADRKYCTRRCADQAHAHDANHRRRVRRTAAFRERVVRREIADRDGWCCQICRKAIPQAARFPDLLSLSIDHIVPLSQGGTHEPSNCQAAHFLCNSLKGCGGEDQLRLVG